MRLLVWALRYDDATDELRVALLGRPNVGKSSLLNKLTGTERSIVSDEAGTTRDAIDQTVYNHGTKFTFVDTAGVRRAAKVRKGIEELMVRRSLKAGKRSDVCLLVIDATEGVSEQESRLARFIVESGRACVVLINKWDLVPNKDDALYCRNGCLRSRGPSRSMCPLRRGCARTMSSMPAARPPHSTVGV